MMFLLIVSLAYGYDCEFSLPTGEKYDFSAFIRDVPDYEANSMNFNYRLNICIDTLILCNGEFGVASQWDYAGGCVAVLARQFPTPPTLSKQQDSLVLTYYNGDFCDFAPRKVNYIFHCTSSKTKIGLAEESEPCVYNFDVYSKYACFNPTKEEQIEQNIHWAIYWSGVLLVGFFVLGFIYNKYNDKTLSSLEALPFGERIAEIIVTLVSRFR